MVILQVKQRYCSCFLFSKTLGASGLCFKLKWVKELFFSSSPFQPFYLSFLPPDIDAPTNLVTIEETEDTATVSWDRVQAEIEGYMLSYTTAEGSSSDIPVGRDSTSYKLIGLKPGVLHTVYIWAFRGDRVSSKTSTEAETGKLWMGAWLITGADRLFGHCWRASQNLKVNGGR